MRITNTVTRQQGAALLAMVLVIFIAASAMLFNAAQPPVRNQYHDIDTSKELMKAKEALIAYSTNYAQMNSSNDGSGRLPCPDSAIPGTANSGLPAASCDWSAASRLPEYVELATGGRFQLNDHYAEVDRQFWYAITPEFRHDYASGVVNSSTSTSLTLDGEDVVAVLIAPGAEISDQVRPSSDVEGVDYLEGGNEDPDSTDFVSGNADNFNDLVLGITHSEIMTPITDMVVAVIQETMDFYSAQWYFDEDYSFVLPPAFGGRVYTGDELGNIYNLSTHWYRTDAWYPSTIESYTLQLGTSNKVVTIKFWDCASVFTLTYGEDEIDRAPARC